MARTFTNQDLELLGYFDPETIRDDPTYRVVRARARAGIEVVDATFLYLKSGSTTESVGAAAAAVTALGVTRPIVVTPGSLGSKHAAWKVLLPTGARLALHEDLIWQSVNTTFAPYLSALREQLPSLPYYVVQRAESDNERDLDQAVIDWLTRREDQTPELIQAVLAPAGLGKTTLARHVTRRLAERANSSHIIPVYVEALHWGRLLGAFERLWDVIQNSLQHFCPGLHISKEAFDHLMRSGDIAFVFDGFDELCGGPGARFNGLNVLDELRALAKTSSARIVVTSRRLFWESLVGDTVNDIHIQRLAPFVKAQATRLIDLRFKEKPDVLRRARGLFDGLRAQNQPPTPGGGKSQLTYNPFVVDLICNAAESGVETLGTSADSPDEMSRVLLGMCERERHRQGLATDALAQLHAFEELAVGGFEEFSSEDAVLAGFALSDQSSVPGHPLMDAAGTRLQFRYEFLSTFLRARYLVRLLAAPPASPSSPADDVVRIIRAEGMGDSPFFEHMTVLWPSAVGPDQLAAWFGPLTRLLPSAGGFLFHLARRIVDVRSANLDRRERTTRMFCALFGDVFEASRVVSRLHVRGKIDRLSLIGVTFNQCAFEDIIFDDCVVDKSTRFVDCRFDGALEIQGRDRAAWGAVDWGKHVASRDAAIEIAGLRSEQVADREEIATAVLEMALEKFWRSGRIQRSIDAAYWGSGRLGKSRFADLARKVLIRNLVVEEVTISGVTQGGLRLRDGASEDLTHFMDSRQMTGRVAAAFRDLSREL